MKLALRLWLVVLFSGITGLAHAKTDWAKTALDPAKAYVLVQIDPLEFRMMGNNAIATGFNLAPYDAARGQIRPTREEGKPLRIDRVSFRQDPVAKDGKRRQYFVALSPGTWVVEGAGSDLPTLAGAATSFALGSYRFEAHAGEVIDLGVVLVSREESDNPDTKMTGGKMLGMMLAGPFGGGRVEPLPLKLDIRPRGTGDLALPAWISKSTLVHPAFTYGATFANFLGGLVNRVDGKAGRGRAVGDVVYLSGPAPETPAAPPQ